MTSPVDRARDCATELRPTRRQIYAAIAIGGPASIGMAFPTLTVAIPCALVMLTAAIVALRWPRAVLGGDDEAYPYRDEVPDFDALLCPLWHLVEIAAFHEGGIWARRCTWFGWSGQDDTWDMLDESKAGVGNHLSEEATYDTETRERHRRNWELWQQLPRVEQCQVEEWWPLSFSVIYEVDPIGDALHPIPHLLCRFEGELGPYLTKPVLRIRHRAEPLDAALRRPKLAGLSASPHSVGE